MIRIASTIAAFGLLAGAAQADVVLTFGFTDLAGEFDGGSAFTADSVSAGVLQSSGDVSRLLAPGGTADYDAGFASGGFSMNIGVPAVRTDPTSGGFTITDADGDTITGDINGNWVSGGGDIVFFTGSLSNVNLNDLGGIDGSFDGPSGGSFGLDIPSQPLEGALVTLFIATGSGFFDSAFSDVSTQVDGVVVPAPAGLMALAGLGLIASRRRRA